MANHCTLFPDGDYGSCCKRHDKRYANQRLSKWQSDELLRRCVKRKNTLIANIMWLGVTLFGYPWYYFANKKNRIKRKKRMYRLLKSSTFKSGVAGVGALSLLNVNQESVTGIINGVAILAGHGELATTIITIVTGLLTLFGIGSGRLEAEKKPPLNKR